MFSMVAWKTYRVSYIWSVNHTRKKVHQIYSQMIPPIQLIAPTMPILRITNLAAFTGFPNHRTSCSKPIPPAPPNPRQAPMILFTSLKIPCGDTFIEAYSQAARRPVKPLVGARLRMAVNKPQGLISTGFSCSSPSFENRDTCHPALLTLTGQDHKAKFDRKSMLNPKVSARSDAVGSANWIMEACS